MSFNYCGYDHSLDQCPLQAESINYYEHSNQNQNNPHSNDYNPGWRNQPNFRWGSNQSAGPMPQSPPKFQANAQKRLQQPIGKKLSMEEMIIQFTQIQQQHVQIQPGSLRNLQNQIGQLASVLNNRPSGRLPCNSQVPKQEDAKECKVVELRRGKELPKQYKADESESKEEKEGQCTKEETEDGWVEVEKLVP